MAFTHSLIPKSWKIAELKLKSVSALFTQEYSLPPKTFSHLCQIMFFPNVKWKHMLFVSREVQYHHSSHYNTYHFSLSRPRPWNNLIKVCFLFAFDLILNPRHEKGESWERLFRRHYNLRKIETTLGFLLGYYWISAFQFFSFLRCAKPHTLCLFDANIQYTQLCFYPTLTWKTGHPKISKPSSFSSTTFLFLPLSFCWKFLST